MLESALGGDSDTIQNMFLEMLNTIPICIISD